MVREQSNSFSLANTIIGVKIEKIAKRQTSNAFKFNDIFSGFEIEVPTASSKSENRDIITNIFGEEKPMFVFDEVKALKRMGFYVDDFTLGQKKYMLLKHVDGVQLLKYVKTRLSQLDIQEQADAFARIVHACIQALTLVHQQQLSHSDAQFKNFIFDPETHQAVMVDFGSAILDASRCQMESDFIVLKNEFDYFDDYFNQPGIQDVWQKCKKEFSDLCYKNVVDIESLVRVVDTFSRQVRSINAKQRLISSSASSDSDSFTTNSNSSSSQPVTFFHTSNSHSSSSQAGAAYGSSQNYTL